jgi:hypothetical protein
VEEVCGLDQQLLVRELLMITLWLRWLLESALSRPKRTEKRGGKAARQVETVTLQGLIDKVRSILINLTRTDVALAGVFGEDRNTSRSGNSASISQFRPASGLDCAPTSSLGRPAFPPFDASTSPVFITLPPPFFLPSDVQHSSQDGKTTIRCVPKHTQHSLQPFLPYRGNKG